VKRTWRPGLASEQTREIGLPGSRQSHANASASGRRRRQRGKAPARPKAAQRHPLPHPPINVSPKKLSTLSGVFTPRCSPPMLSFLVRFRAFSSLKFTKLFFTSMLNACSACALPHTLCSAPEQLRPSTAAICSHTVRCEYNHDSLRYPQSFCENCQWWHADYGYSGPQHPEVCSHLITRRELGASTVTGGFCAQINSAGQMTNIRVE
jgi:hypothetical protein